MHKIRLSFSLLLMAVVALMPTSAFAVDTENFYFEDFTADYYLSKDDEGVSHLEVIENFTTVFPNYKQNKGICRMIPFTNQNNKNVTLPNLNAANIKVKRNGLVEPIYSIEKSGNYYEVCTGTDEYVLGQQIYTFEYEFERVITDFSDYQELYWDTNGNGWSQRFNSVTARVHFMDDEVANAYADKKWCYVGRYGANGSERCVVFDIEDGVEFRAVNLLRGENLTFDLEFKLGSFVVPEPGNNYTLVVLLIGILVVCALFLINPIKNFAKTREKARYYNGLFIKPEFTPNPDYSISEMAEVYMGSKKDEKVAVLLDMIVRHQIALINKGTTTFGKTKWAIKVLKKEEISKEGVYLLRILNGWPEINNGDEIEIKTRTATSALVSLRNSYDRAVSADLKQHGLIEKKHKTEMSNSAAMSLIIFICVVMPIGLSFIGILGEMMDELAMVGNVILEDEFFGIVAIAILATCIARMILNSKAKKFLYRTTKGLEASRYMDGLKLYISMAEKDRLAFLQSVKGADTSTEGIVHLYEKLLPYAAVLGVEKSWMNELEKYYKLEEIETPDWYTHNITSFAVLNAVNSAVSSANHSTTYSSSGGSSSSGSSGGGGGGFSGGGGGGGGGHGR